MAPTVEQIKSSVEACSYGGVEVKLISVSEEQVYWHGVKYRTVVYSYGDKIDSYNLSTSSVDFDGLIEDVTSAVEIMLCYRYRDYVKTIL